MSRGKAWEAPPQLIHWKQALTVCWLLLNITHHPESFHIFPGCGHVIFPHFSHCDSHPPAEAVPASPASLASPAPRSAPRPPRATRAGPPPVPVAAPAAAPGRRQVAPALPEVRAPNNVKSWPRGTPQYNHKKRHKESESKVLIWK